MNKRVFFAFFLIILISFKLSGKEIAPVTSYMSHDDLIVFAKKLHNTSKVNTNKEQACVHRRGKIVNYLDLKKRDVERLREFFMPEHLYIANVNYRVSYENESIKKSLYEQKLYGITIYQSSCVKRVCPDGSIA